MLFKLVGIPRIISEEGYQSGQMGRAVNPLTSVFESSIFPPPPNLKTLIIMSVIGLDFAGVVQW